LPTQLPRKAAAGDLRFELVLKVSPPEGGDGFLRALCRSPGATAGEACVATGPAACFSTFHAVEFSKTGAASNGIKKPPTRAEAFSETGTGRIRFARRASSCSRYRDLFMPPVRAAAE